MTMGQQLITRRLILRSWRRADAETALEVYGDAEVARWLSPAMDRPQDIRAMSQILARWADDEERLVPPAGRWAIERREDSRLIGGAILLPLPPDDRDIELGWQLHRAAWGHGYATEAGQALAQWAFDQGLDELLAVVRPANKRAAAAVRRIGMEWVGETDKYYDLRLQVFRLRPADLDSAHPRNVGS